MQTLWGTFRHVARGDAAQCSHPLEAPGRLSHQNPSTFSLFLQENYSSPEVSLRTLHEFKAWVTWKHSNTKPKQVGGPGSAHLPAEQPLCRRGVHGGGRQGFSLPDQWIASSHVVEMVFWNLQERAGVCWLRLHRRL